MSLIEFNHASFRKFDRIVFPDTCWTLPEGEHWALTGANASGKTTFLEVVAGQWIATQGETAYHLSDDEIASVFFCDRQINYGNFYYQQRYHATETDGVVTVREFLELQGNALPEILQTLNLLSLLNMEIIKLSNGQFKKLFIVKALLKKPRLLLLDNLFIGLDAQARDDVNEALTCIAGMDTQIIMTAESGQIPAFITHVMEIAHFSISRTCLRTEAVTAARQVKALPELPEPPVAGFDTAVHLHQVTIRYNGKTIIDQVEWLIRRGEKWALTGANGAGKSMLLSLIFADNPQAYANRITIFDRLRGTGESIWDIKERIGFVSPEMHFYNKRHITCMDYVMEGLQDNPYVRYMITEKNSRFAAALFAYFSVEDIAETSFQRISTGQQNIVLLIRALVKNPPMLLLDEPFQGLDAENVALARALLDAYCKDRTLIFVSHNPAELPDGINRHLKIEDGKAKMIKNIHA
ncbi:MAG: ATP-binding cassette domain-containing protein [Bacteroidales bacterium]|jgi:molybdate transport system ATP-binding protein|nr:ATP-binding cassette domain-containing protein [Bacteroidales bacterium]